jgi:hypothetical protein
LSEKEASHLFVASEVNIMAVEIIANKAVSNARGLAQLVFVVAAPAAVRTVAHLIGALRRPDNVSGTLNAALLVMLVASMIVSHVRFMRQLTDPATNRDGALVRLADAESSVAAMGFIGILLALGFPFSIG